MFRPSPSNPFSMYESLVAIDLKGDIKLYQSKTESSESATANYNTSGLSIFRINDA